MQTVTHAAKKAPNRAPLTWWDAYSDKAPYESDAWATSDRGWLFREGDQTSLGHYLDYGPVHHRTSPEWCAGCGGEFARNNSVPHYCAGCQPGTVHAVSCVTRESRYCVTVEDAQRWLEVQAGITTPCPVHRGRRPR